MCFCTKQIKVDTYIIFSIYVEGDEHDILHKYFIIHNVQERHLKTKKVKKNEQQNN
jgi:hypothetical protein